MSTTIVVTGLIVVLMSACGGAWAVVASDFLQMLVIMAVSFVASLVAIFKSGGIVPILEQGLPENPLSGPGYNCMWLFLAWTIASFCKQFLSTNNMIDSYRYMCAKDTKNARKGALLACVLMLAGPFIWFLPDWFVAARYPDTGTWNLSSLGSGIKDATYYIFVRNEMPAGTVGLMLAAIFAATMSSMDSALNRNAGIFVRNFYKPILRPHASDQEMLHVGQISTFGFGAIIIAVGVFLNSLENTSLFNMMMMVSSLISLPILIPSLLGFFVKKTPDWAAWATILVGAAVSSFVAFIITPEMIQTFLGLSTPLTDREFSDMQSLTLGLILHLCITIPFFLSTRLFYKEYSPQRRQEVEQFFSNISTEVSAENSDAGAIDHRQRSLLGKLAAALGLCICLLVFIPNTFTEKMVFIGIGGIILLAGIGLLFSAKGFNSFMNPSSKSHLEK